MSQSATQSIVCETLIGREEQLAFHRDLVTDVRNGEGCVTLVCGEAGVGKSRFIDELRTIAVDRGFHALPGVCYEQDAVFPFAPFIDLLRSALISHTDKQMQDAFGATAAELLQLAPELAHVVPGGHAAKSLSPEFEKMRLFQMPKEFVTSRVAKSTTSARSI